MEIIKSLTKAITVIGSILGIFAFFMVLSLLPIIVR